MNQGTLLAGKYRVGRLLGEGGMGQVVAAVHEQLGQRVAIKFLLPEAMAHPEAVERFLREARASVKLRSEHVGRVIDVGTLENGAPYMVMEYLEGNDLGGELARRGALPVVEVVDYVLQACEAIAEAHAHGLVHRDIKPANLFLTRAADGSPLVKVLDFGIAKAAPTDPSFNMTRTRAVMGSPGYMSPEQLRSSRQVDARSDIWSLGVVLYELLSGRKPFSGETFSELCITIATEPPAPLGVPGVPAELVATIDRCLAKDPAHRFQNVAELAAALEPFADAARGAAARIARVLRIPLDVPPAGLSAPGQGQPTTLSSLASEQRRPGAGAGRGRWVAGGAVAVVAGAAVLVAALAMRSPARAGGARRAAAAGAVVGAGSRASASVAGASASAMTIDAAVPSSVRTAAIDAAAPTRIDAAPAKGHAVSHRADRNRADRNRADRNRADRNRADRNRAEKHRAAAHHRSHSRNRARSQSGLELNFRK